MCTRTQSLESLNLSFVCAATELPNARAAEPAGAPRRVGGSVSGASGNSASRLFQAGKYQGLPMLFPLSFLMVSFLEV